MNEFLQEIKNKLVHQAPKKVVFPEATDKRIIGAASKLAEEGIIVPILLGNKNEINQIASDLNIDISLCNFMDPENYDDFTEMVNTFMDCRNSNDYEASASLLRNPNYFGTMLVYMEMADGLVSGACHTTADTIRPAFQIIKTKPGRAKASGVFVMVKGREKYLFADCSINISPTSEDLAEIALESAATAAMFHVDPKIALLSFSTKSPIYSERVLRIREALTILKEKQPNLIVEGEVQFDAAFIPQIAEKKAPNSKLNGNANIFIFPNLEAGNIACKIIERLTPYEIIGPILQGLNKPINDLSRGCSMADVYQVALITAMQSIRNNDI